MLIKYPSAHKWIENISSDATSELGKNNKGRIRSTLKNITNTNVTYSIEPLTNTALEWFTPLYVEQISKKNNANVYDIYSSTLGKESKYTYYILTLMEDKVPIGATIFSERKKIISIAYRIYPNNWLSNHNLQASPSLYSEFLINQYGYNRGFSKLSHGKDRNPYGMNANIGLALFKLSVGCHVYLPSTPFEILELDSDKVINDLLVFAMPEKSDQKITQGYLCITEENITKYENVTKYPNQIKIDIIPR